MNKKRARSRALRKLADDFLRKTLRAGDVPPGGAEELATSLVRQWLTCDGNATLFVGEHQLYLRLSTTPLGNSSVAAQSGGPGWVRDLREHWKINPGQLPDVLGQLNRGQSAEVTNDDGVALRLWVNPREKSAGVEPVVKGPVPRGRGRDHLRKIAADLVEHHAGPGLGADEVEQLARSVAGQWQKYDGHASLFVKGGEEQLVFTLTEKPGGCDVGATRLTASLVPALGSYGFPADALPGVIARINLDQEIEFRDASGAPSRLWYDPRARRICLRSLRPDRSAAPSALPPLLCPRCGAVLNPWREGQRQQACPLCGHAVALPG